MKRHVLSVIVGLWAYGFMGLWAAFSQSETPTRVGPPLVDCVVAAVNGEVITLSMVEDAMNAIWIDPQEVPKSRRDALQKLIDHKLKLQEARRLGVDIIVSEESLSRESAKVLSRFASPKELSEALRRRGITQEDLEENLREQIVVQEMVTREFRSFAEVTDAEASEYFELHREEFMVPEAVHLSQIFFQFAPNADKAAKDAVRKRAEGVLKELKSGVDFSTYAVTTGSDARATIDYVAVDQLIPAVAAAVSRLEVGEISDPIETATGYFIIKLNDRRPTRQATFDEVKEEIKEHHLLQQKTDDALQAWLERQRELADIRVKVELVY